VNRKQEKTVAAASPGQGMQVAARMRAAVLEGRVMMSPGVGRASGRASCIFADSIVILTFLSIEISV
jgi:hypothetical protein